MFVRNDDCTEKKKYLFIILNNKLTSKLKVIYGYCLIYEKESHMKFNPYILSNVRVKWLYMKYKINVIAHKNLKKSHEN